MPVLQPKEVSVEKRGTKAVSRKEEIIPYEGMLGNSPEIRVLSELTTSPQHEYTKVELASGASVSRSTLDQVLDKFEGWGIVVKGRKVGPMQLYRLNTENPMVAAFMRFSDEAAMIMALNEAPPESNPAK